MTFSLIGKCMKWPAEYYMFDNILGSNTLVRKNHYINPNEPFMILGMISIGRIEYYKVLLMNCKIGYVTRVLLDKTLQSYSEYVVVC